MDAYTDESYFQGKKQMSLEDIQAAVKDANDAATLMASLTYDNPSATDYVEIHMALTQAASRLHTALENFDKARWSASKAEAEFDVWRKANRPDVSVPGSE